MSSATASTKKGSKRACPEPEVHRTKKQTKSCKEDVLEIMREHGATFEREVARLGPSELELMGVVDVMSTSTTPVREEYEPLFTTRGNHTSEELVEIDAMRFRRNTLLANVNRLIDGRLLRGFRCKNPEWIACVKNVAVVAAVGAENMHGPFDFGSWIVKYARANKIIDVKAFPRLGVTQTDVQLMIAISIYTFVQACWRVHINVRDSQAIPAVQSGDLMHALRVTFGVFSVPSKRRDSNVLSLAAMMLASTLSTDAMYYTHTCLAEIRIPVSEMPTFEHIPIELFLRPHAPVVSTSSDV